MTAATLKTLGTVPGLSQLMEHADYMDMKTFSGEKDLSEFVATMLNYKPAWLNFLYLLRKGVAKILGLSHSDIEKTDLTPNDVDFTPGAQVAFFTTFAGEPGNFWIAEATDKHLAGYIGVIREERPDNSANFHTFTIVHYRHWTGPLYFNLIRPFHHLIVHYMGKAAAR